ncbi:Putative membrane protein C6F6.13c [Tolypocladium paradoxum]|uniref:Membrane protein C6F6.13c n=1 Tax=Tolypocladium paradoxum TaxID=94208 RepID=A0A2S4L6P3_9HYPO|nr:Putative membrane protein C6F6.13c [Tolypocladium paradoxum]
MGRGGRGGNHQSFRRPADLTGVMSVAERNDLTTLVTAITEKMHNDISSIFDSPAVTPVLGEQEHHHCLSLALFRRLEDSKENKLPPPLPPSQPKAAAFGDGSKTYKKAHQIVEKEETEAMTPQLSELKKEALLFFRKWQNGIIQRIREININDTPPPQGNPRGRGARGSRGGSRGRGARGGGRNARGGLTLAIGPPRIPANQMDRELAQKFPPIPNTLWALHVDKRKLLLHVAILLVLSLQDYNGNARVFLLNLTSSLNLSLDIYLTDELRVSQGLAKVALQLAPIEEPGQKPEENKGPRRWKVGHGGGSGSNTSLAAPLKTAGIGAVHAGLSLSTAAVAGLLGAMADHGHLLGNLFGMNAVRPTSKMLETCCREVPDFAFRRLYDEAGSEYRDARESPAEDRRLRVVIALSGCLSEKDDVVKPWRGLGHQAETYAVQWEVTALMNLGSALETVIKSTAWDSAKKEIMSRSIFSSLIESSWPIPLLKVSKIIDNPWGLGMVRAEKAGAILADTIVRHKFQGERSVSLIGYSLAARAIYTCLMVLAERRQFGLIDSVVMIGTPAPSESRVWLTLKSVVSGRLVNVYSEQDFILGFLYRTANIHFGVAGLQEIQGAHGVENHCVKDLPRGHLDYQNITGQILKDIGWEGFETNAVKADQAEQKPAAKRGKSDQ